MNGAVGVQVKQFSSENSGSPSAVNDFIKDKHVYDVKMSTAISNGRIFITYLVIYDG